MQGLLQQAQGGAMPAEEQLPPEEEGLDPEDDQALQAATDYVLDQLYGEPNLSEEMARSFAEQAEFPPKLLAGIAYQLAQAADAATGGNIAEENLSMLGMLTLAEVAEIASATGKNIDAAAISATFKQMVVMFLEDQDVDATAIAEAFAQVDDRDFAQLVNEIPAGEEPQAPMQQEVMA